MEPTTTKESEMTQPFSDKGRAELVRIVGPELVAKMERSAAITGERCYLHPESPTGYVGKGRWCEHKRAAYEATR
jgi:hypothetical protein